MQTDGWTDASSSPLQELRAVVSIQTVRHAAPALLVVVHHLYLNRLHSIYIFRKFGEKAKIRADVEL